MRLHLDADTSIRALYTALVERGFDVTRTPNEWMTADATDVEQLLGASAMGRSVFTFNVRDFMVLAARYPKHAGIVLAMQSKWRLGPLVRSLSELLEKHRAEDLGGQVLWL